MYRNLEHATHCRNTCKGRKKEIAELWMDSAAYRHIFAITNSGWIYAALLAHHSWKRMSSKKAHGRHVLLSKHVLEMQNMHLADLSLSTRNDTLTPAAV